MPAAAIHCHCLCPSLLRPAGAGLQILALHNSHVSPAALAVVLAACPQLLMLLLGGCTLSSSRASMPLPPAAMNPSQGAQTQVRAQALGAVDGCALWPGRD